MGVQPPATCRASPTRCCPTPDHHDTGVVGGTDERTAPAVFVDIMGFVAAALAGTGGALFGVRAADAVHRWRGRDAPSAEEPAEATETACEH